MRKKIKDNPSFGLSFLYNSAAGRLILKIIANNSIISRISSIYMNSFLSKPLINYFVKKYDIDMNEYIKDNYKCFNDFFIRKIKPKRRPINNNKNYFISPCDCKLTYYKIRDDLKFKVKNSIYSVSSIVKNKIDMKEYKNGIVLVFRLSPENYHRYCFVDSGILSKKYYIKGKYHSVNPISYNNYKVFKENSREVNLLKTDNFNDIISIEVGALLVGKIVNYDIIKFNKGLEKGYFKYGGSTIVLILKDNVVDIDKEIITNSLNGFETCVKYGEKIGVKFKKL